MRTDFAQEDALAIGAVAVFLDAWADSKRLNYAAELAEMNKRGEITGCIVEGPFALDNAISPEAAAHKGVKGEVAGKADIIMVPDIEAGNLLIKSMEYFAHAKKAGVILGAKTPIALTSRASTAESKLYTIAVARLAARMQQ